jgi:hypothetical protein
MLSLFAEVSMFERIIEIVRLIMSLVDGGMTLEQIEAKPGNIMPMAG